MRVVLTRSPSERFMDTSRFVLIIALSLVSMMLWQAWEEDYGQKAKVEPAGNSTDLNRPGLPAETEAPSVEIPEQGFSPDPVISTPPAKLPAPENVTKPAAGIINVETDLFRFAINTRGGSIEKAAMKKFPVTAKQPDNPYVLLDNSEDLLYIIQGGLLSKDGAPNHQAIYSAQETDFHLSDDKDRLYVPLSWRSQKGLQVKKIFEFNRGSYLVKVRYEIENQALPSWQARPYQQIKRSAPTEGRKLVYTYTGAVISSPEERYEKIDFDDLQDRNLKKDISNGWIAMLQHYFVTALVPVQTDTQYRYYTNALADDKYIIGAIGPSVQAGAGETAVIEEQFYLGPKILRDLDSIADGLELTVDYGMLWFIAKPLFLVLDKLHELTGNWGWSIILVTIILKLLFFPLSAAGYRSMANMRRVQPRLVALKDRYKDDRTKLNQAMMQIYKEEKINPFGGCFPILVQIPVFIALYWVLLESVELRQASFALWLQDLSSKDPYFVLPVIMGVTMFAQQKLNPAPMDPIQEKVMSFLPFVFTVFFAFFPSGLVLYWVVNNILSIAQQWQITRSLERAGITGKS